MPDLPISGLPAITVVSTDYLLAAVSESVTAQMTVKQVGDAYSSSLSLFPYVGAAEITGSLSITGSTAFTGSNTIVGGLKISNFTGFGDPASLQFRTYHDNATTDGAWYSWGTEFLQMGPINSGTDATYTMAFVPADNSTGYIPVDRPSLLFNADSQIYLNGSRNFRIYSPSVRTFTVENMNTVISGSLNVTGSRTTLSSSFYIQSSSLFNQSTGSSLVSYDTASGQLFHTPYSSALPALFSVGAFYSTGSTSVTGNQSGSFTYTTSLGINSVNVTNGSRITVERSATYNFQFSIQVHNKSQAVNIAIWLKKNGVNVADTATYVDVPSNQKDLIALNLWDTANAGDYYEIAYQTDNNVVTLFETIAASGNIPQSPSIIVTVNQVR